MRVIFMGTPDFAVGTLKKLAKSEHQVLAVVTQPDKPKGRGKAMQFPPVKEAALKYMSPGKYRLSWAPAEDILEPSAFPTYYIVEERTDDGGVRVVTSDGMIQLSALRKGVTRISAQEFERIVTETEGEITDLIENARRDGKERIGDILKDREDLKTLPEESEEKDKK